MFIFIFVSLNVSKCLDVWTQYKMFDQTMHIGLREEDVSRLCFPVMYFLFVV